MVGGITGSRTLDDCLAMMLGDELDVCSCVLMNPGNGGSISGLLLVAGRRIFNTELVKNRVWGGSAHGT